MLARRIIAVSPDKTTAKRLAVSLKAAGGAVDAHASLDELGKGELQASLVVIHLEGELANAHLELVPRLTGDARVIAILPKPDLSTTIDVMQSSPRIIGVMTVDQLDSNELAAMATRVLAGDIFGLDKIIPWGTQIHSQLVGDYQEKSLCISQISEFAELMGVRRKYRESIEQCVDEMLMNALYDAPIDEQGQPIFADIPTRTRISLRVEQKIFVQYACDGKRFAVSVRDAFGTLERDTVLKYVYKCLHADQQIDRKAGGAGLGLYLMVNSASTLYFDVLPGVATEAVTVFDLDVPKLQLERFGFFTEKIDAAGRLASGPSRRLPAGASHPVERRTTVSAGSTPRALLAVLILAIVATLGLTGVMIWPRLFGAAKAQVTITTVPKGAMIEIEGHNAGTTTDGTLVIGDLETGRAYPVVAKLPGYEQKQTVVQPHAGTNQLTLELVALGATVFVDSQPTGASIEIDGKPVGTTPMTLTSLPPGTSASVVFKKAGYHDAVTHLDVPGPGKEVKIMQPMSITDDLARIRLESEPPGAQVTQNGQLLAAVTTPCEVLVEAGKQQHFVLNLAKHVPGFIDLVPSRGAEVTKTAQLADGWMLNIESTVDGKIAVGGAQYCAGMSTPAHCIVTPGKHAVEFTGAAGVRSTRLVTTGKADVTERFEFGVVVAGPGKTLSFAGSTGVRRAVLEVGQHSVTVTDESGSHATTVRVTANATVVAN